jgi:monovalent cation:H+ antiporter, CPA1 family
MFLGIILATAPIIELEVEEFYDVIECIPEIILFVIIPILIFESGRKLKIEQIKKEAVPVGFFAIIGAVITILIIGIGVKAYFRFHLLMHCFSELF